MPLGKRSDTDKQKLFSSIEALRCLGAIMVVLFHLNTYPSGYKGVDLFFVISGFVLYHRYLLPGTPGESLALYASHRLSKIYLLYWTALLIYLLIGPTISWEGFWRTFFLFPGHHEALSVSWSLSFELYFYILFAVFLLLKRPAHRNTLLLFLLIGTTAITILDLITHTLRGTGVNFLLGHNTWEFILGLSAGYLFENNRLKHRWWVSLGLLISLCLFCFLSLPYAAPVSPVIYGPAGLGLVYFSACLDQRRFSSPILTLLGLSSYAIYLFHTVLLERAQAAQLTHPLVFIPLITLLSILVYKFYEAPLLRAIRNGFARRLYRSEASSRS